MISENIGPNATDVFAQAMKVAGEAGKLCRDGETHFAEFQDGTIKTSAFDDRKAKHTVSMMRIGEFGAFNMNHDLCHRLQLRSMSSWHSSQ